MTPDEASGNSRLISNDIPALLLYNQVKRTIIIPHTRKPQSSLCNLFAAIGAMLMPAGSDNGDEENAK
jgi:hypothetical protein